MVTFAVDDVAPVVTRLATQRLGDRVPDALVHGRDPDLEVVPHGPTHALLGAVHVAFAEHRPLFLTPDAVWLTIAEGVAQHVRLHAERLRAHLVRHVGTKRLEVRVGAVPVDAAGWQAVIPQFRALLAGEIGEGRARLFECNFTTSTEIDRIASQVVLMDAYAPFFDYWMTCICGIPSITLAGTADDWRAIRSRIDVIAELELGTWCRSLAPIIDQFVAAASGSPDRAFWQRIYKPKDAYGGSIITGWIARLYPYLESAGSAAYPNPLLALPLDEPRGDTATGIRSDNVLAGPSSVRINIAGLTDTRAVQLEAGVMIVVQNNLGQIVPMASWWCRPGRAAIQDVVERIRADHEHRPAPENSLGEGPADMIGFYNLISEAWLHGDRWTIRGAGSHRSVMLSKLGYIEATAMIDCIDGRAIAHIHRGNQSHWVVLPPGWATNEQIGLEIPVVAHSLAEVLEALLDSAEPPGPKYLLGAVLGIPREEEFDLENELTPPNF